MHGLVVHGLVILDLLILRLLEHGFVVHGLVVLGLLLSIGNGASIANPRSVKGGMGMVSTYSELREERQKARGAMTSRGWWVVVVAYQPLEQGATDQCGAAIRSILTTEENGRDTTASLGGRLPPW